MKRSRILFYFLLILFVCISLILFIKKPIEGFQQEKPVGIANGWYINLDKSTERKQKVEAEVKKLGNLPITRWPATNGRILTEQDFDRLNVPAWSRPSFAKDEKSRAGHIGCILSHITLLKHLQNQPVSDKSLGHLILEDDIRIDDDVVKAWNTAYSSLDPTWDMVFFGLLGDKKVNNVKNGVGKPEWILGTHAYVVKHSSIPKILSKIQLVYDPIDEMYGRSMDSINIYALSPFKIHQRGEDESLILKGGN